MPPGYSLHRLLPLLIIAALVLAAPTHAFGAGYVSRGSGLQGYKFRHGDIANAVYFLATANSRLVRTIYFGNWLRDFSQLLDKRAIEVVPEEILRALVAVLAFVQFGYSTREFEVTAERLGYYRPEEHIDNPKGYDGGIVPGLREQVQDPELNIDPKTAMKNYIANSEIAHINPTSYQYIEEQLVAAIACGRDRNPEAYVHLGAAMHTLEDFIAHSNWVELCMQMLGRGVVEGQDAHPALANVFTFVGDAGFVETKRGPAPPLITGTFGALDLYQTLLGEIDDKVTAMSIPGLRLRMPQAGTPLKGIATSLISALNGADNKTFDSDIGKIVKSASEKPADWGELNKTPNRLWSALEPVFKLRDDIVKWIYDNLTLDSVQNAIAAISTALDKLVYWVVGVFLGPVLTDISKALKEQQEALLIKDKQSRLASGEQSIFDDRSTNTDPTHSELCKDHYDDELNELAGKVATKISEYTIRSITQVWQHGNTADVRPVLAKILSALHHPYNFSAESEVQNLMVTEVVQYCSARATTDPVGFSTFVTNLDKAHVATRLGEEAARTHADELTTAQESLLRDGPSNAPDPIMTQVKTPAHTLTTIAPEHVQGLFAERIGDNIASSIKTGLIPGLGLSDIPGLKQLMASTSSPDNPNPIDQALSNVGSVGLLPAFENIEIHDIVAAPGMGNVLKEAVINMLLKDPERVRREEAHARERFGGLAMSPAVEAQALLDIHVVDRDDSGIDDGRGSGSGGGKTQFMRRAMEKLKLSKN